MPIARAPEDVLSVFYNPYGFYYIRKLLIGKIMNKSFQYLYSIIFWILRFITLSIFGISFFAVLNAKYIWSETFFTTLINISFNVSYYIHKLLNSNNLLSVVNTSFYATPTKTFKYTLFSKFCANAQQVDILLLSVLLILIISMCMRFFIKKSIYFDLIAIFVIYLLVYLYTSLNNILFLPIMTLSIFLIAIFINKYNKIKEIIKYIPIISELFCIDLILNKILNKTINKKTIIFIILIESLICSNMLYFIIPFKNDNFINRIYDKSVYSISNLKNKMILATSHIAILHDDTNFFIIDNNNFDYIEDVIINNYKNEIYIYDTRNGKLIFLDIDNFKVIDELDFKDISGIDSLADVRMCCDETRSKLLLVFEDSGVGAFLVDLSNHAIIKKYKVASPRDSVIYNKYRNSFIITFFQQLHGFLQEIKCDNSSKVENIDSDIFQGYICISNKNKEVYVAFHQQGRIGVYDAQTMKLKRKIKTNYTVKDITYDEELNVLIAPSYFTGYVDIFLMNGTDRLLAREFIGYELRQAKFDFKKENLYVCSRYGLYQKKLDIKKMIKMFHMKQSNGKNIINKSSNI